METSNCKGKGTGGTGYQAVIEVPEDWLGLVERHKMPSVDEVRRDGWITANDYASMTGLSPRAAKPKLDGMVSAGECESRDARTKSGRCVVYRPIQPSSGSGVSKQRKP